MSLRSKEIVGDNKHRWKGSELVEILFDLISYEVIN